MRADLLALSEDALVALSNRGFVKKGKRDLDAGRVPAIEELDDGTIVGRFEDGRETRLPPDTPLRDTICTCGARNMCRHRVCLVLAYGRAHAADVDAGGGTGDGEGFEAWSPAIFDDAMVEKRIGKRAMERARTLRRRGYVAKVRRPSAADPIPTVELSTATVRFLAPRDLAYAHSDSVEGHALELLALAVWAYRAADEMRPDAAEVEVEVAPEAPPEATGATGLEEALALADEVLLEGVVHGRPSLAASFARARQTLVTAKITWPVLCVDEIEEQLDAYQTRSARYRPAVLADLLAELHARDRAARRGGELPARRVLGSEESMETSLDHLRLISLGTRVVAHDRDRRADVFLADPDTATVLVLRKEWRFREDESPLSGPRLASKAVAAHATLRTLAGGNVVTAAAKRRASRLVTFGRGRVARTSVTPSEGEWDALPEMLRVVDVAAHEAVMRARPPRLIRPRVLAESVCAVVIEEVHEIVYRPGAQTLWAEVADPAGNSLALRLAYRSVTPGALDLLAATLAGEHGAPKLASGVLRRTPRGLVLEPLSVVTETGLHLLDLAAEIAEQALETGDLAESDDPVAAAIARIHEALEDGAHHGLRRAPSHVHQSLDDAARAARGVGLRKMADGVDALRHAVGRAQQAGETAAEHAAARAWFDARIRARLTEEAL